MRRTSIRSKSWRSVLSALIVGANSGTQLSGTELAKNVPVQKGLSLAAAPGLSQVPIHIDPESKEKPNTLVSLPSQPLSIAVITAVAPE